MNEPSPVAILSRVPIGRRIRVGDWWRDVHGYWNQRESVRWFERQKEPTRQAQHYRVIGLWQSPTETGVTK